MAHCAAVMGDPDLTTIYIDGATIVVLCDENIIGRGIYVAYTYFTLKFVFIFDRPTLEFLLDGF